MPERSWYFNSQPHKEADIRPLKVVEYRKDFNSQPHKEADVNGVVSSWQFRTFQLTASQGGWRPYTAFVTSFPNISTHSLTRRLTAWSGRSRQIPSYFNSQPHKEADVFKYVIFIIASLFQLTASQGGWRKTTVFRQRILKFQLTASQGGWQQFQTKTYLSKTDFSTYYTY